MLAVTTGVHAGGRSDVEASSGPMSSSWSAFPSAVTGTVLLVLPPMVVASAVVGTRALPAVTAAVLASGFVALVHRDRAYRSAASVPDRIAVYTATTDAGTVYVGKTDDPDRRFDEHRRTKPELAAATFRVVRWCGPATMRREWNPETRRIATLARLRRGDVVNEQFADRFVWWLTVWLILYWLLEPFLDEGETL